MEEIDRLKIIIEKKTILSKISDIYSEKKDLEKKGKLDKLTEGC